MQDTQNLLQAVSGAPPRGDCVLMMCADDVGGLAETRRRMISEPERSTEKEPRPAESPLYFRIMAVTCCHGFRLYLSLLCALCSEDELVICPASCESFN